MFKRLTFAVRFASTGQEIRGDHAFQSGLTAITGANEAGKSTRLEMLRYALFGSKALRAGLDAYKTATASVAFTLGGVDYLVDRGLTNARLFRGQEQVAVSTRAVNAKIIELFGYGLDVFDVVHNCAQGRVEQLSSARPAERKALIERTVGMDSIDAVIAAVNKTISEIDGEASGIEKALTLAEPGPQPETTVTKPAHDLAQELDALKAKVWEAASLRGRLSAPQPPVRDRPQKPDTPDISETVAELEATIASAALRDGEIKTLTRERALLPLPMMEEEEMTGLEALHVELLKEFEAEQKLYDLVREKRRLEARGSIQCPKCEHEFPLEHAELEHLPCLPDNVEKPKDPRQRIAEDRALFAMERSRRPNMARVQEIDALLARLGSEDLAVVANDAQRKLGELRQYARDMDRYDVGVQAHESDLLHARQDASERNVARDRLAEIGDVDVLHEQVSKDFAARQAYERDHLAWVERTARQSQIAESLQALKQSAKDWRAGVDALRALKARIKAHLVPSLSAIASSYITRMTDGARTDIRIDEEFNIRVDGTPIEALSGSAKAVANLSIRIALGLVLASRKFSVFLGDEIDASMDEARAESTADALRNLRSQLSQIILVSHKPTEADHTIAL